MRRRGPRCRFWSGSPSWSRSRCPRSGEIRERAEAGLGRGMPAREAELARGFVLGEDEGIDARTEEDFRRAGLSHLLAVSGQNVTLLALLAMPLLAALGIPLRERLLWVLGLIAVYVPLAGAGPSIQRAGGDGRAGVLATLAGRRASRLYALALALIVTLAIDPTIAADVGWQLSFAAVLGILLLARADPGGDRWRGSAPAASRRALAEGVAVTVAATLATAPLIAFHFETLSTTTLVANVLALPAVAPAMWLGMASAAAAQVPGLPVEPLNAPNALLLAYIAQVAAWCGRPSWAEVRVQLGGGGLVGAYAALAVATAAGAALVRCRRRAAAGRWLVAAGRDSRSVLAAFGWRWRLAACLAARVAGRWGGRGSAAGPADRGPRRRPGRRDPAAAGRGAGGARRRRAARRGPRREARARPGSSAWRPRSSPTTSPTTPAGSRSCSAASRSPGSSTGGSGADRSRRPAPPAPCRCGSSRAASCARARSASKSSGRRASCSPRPQPGADPNQLALVLLARWRDFSMLLTADAEAEAVPLDPGPVDVLKVAHHGSDDAGLAALLDRTRPRLAVISVGDGQPLRPPDRRHAGDARRARRPHPAHRPRRRGRDRRRGGARSEVGRPED